MSELKEYSQQIPIEERALHEIAKSPTALPAEPSEVAVSKTTRLESRGDGHKIQIQALADSPFDASSIRNDSNSLCSVDKMRIDHLISELNKCRELKKETELRLLASKRENAAMEKAFETCSTRHEDEKTNMKSKLSMETRKLKELTTNTSYSLGVLSDRISAWERETALIRDIVDELLDQKIHLQNEMSRIELRRMLLTAEEARMKDTSEMKKLQFAKHRLKMDMLMISTCERYCQTEEIETPV